METTSCSQKRRPSSDLESTEATTCCDSSSDAREVYEMEIFPEEIAVEIRKAREFSAENATCIERAIGKLEGLSSDNYGVVEIINYLHCVQLLPELPCDDEAAFMIVEAMNWAAKYEEGAMRNAEGHGLELKPGEFPRSNNDVADNCWAKYAEKHGLLEEAENLNPFPILAQFLVPLFTV